MSEQYNIERKDFMPLSEKLLHTINDHFNSLIGSNEALIIHAALTIMTNSNNDFLKSRGIQIDKTLERIN